MPKGISNDEYIAYVKVVHDDLYDYSKTEYKKSTGKICIICPIHGEFYQRASNHREGQGCKKCASASLRDKLLKSTETLLTQFKNVHGDYYDYSNVVYNSRSGDVEIVCPKHGTFKQNPRDHIKGCGCRLCGNERISKARSNGVVELIKKFNKKHGNKYDYGFIEYEGMNTHVKIICPIHGEFSQTPSCHLMGGCKKCGIDKLKHDTVRVVKDFRKIHKDLYDYSLVEYIDNQTPVNIICKSHGVFQQRPCTHKSGYKCPKCYGKGFNTQEIVEKFITKHGNLYDYSGVEYKGSIIKVVIRCKEHGIFQQTPSKHLSGQGCPLCSNIRNSKQMIQTSKWFEIRNIPYKREVTCEGLYGVKGRFCLRFDFEVNLNGRRYFVEVNGQQHYKPVEYFGGEKQFLIQQQNDEKKRLYCADNGISLIVIKYNQDVGTILTQLLDIN